MAVVEFNYDLGTWGIVTKVLFGFGHTSDLVTADAVFDDHVLTVADAGTTRVASAATDPDFGIVAARLTNGIDDTLCMVSGTHGPASPGDWAAESVWINGGLSGTLVPDAVGHTLTRIQMEVDSVTFASPGSDPNSDGDWTDIRIKGRFVLMGE
ncbi:MAG: hypothetical protein ACC662_03970 [Planctomycetota bacterium]